MACVYLQSVRLFVAEGGERVDAHGAAGGDVAGDECDCDEYAGDNEESEKVGGTDTEEKSCHDVRDDECAGQADGRAAKREAETLAEH